MIAYVAIVVVVILLAVLAYYYFTQMQDEPSLGPSPGPSTGSSLTITENGASLSEGYRMMPRKEGYIQRPQVEKCGTDAAPDYCSAYYASETNGYAYVYDINLTDITGTNYTECPGGGHDCWFIEKYDSEGTLISVVNKDGDNMLEKLLDDVWSANWNVNHPLFTNVSRQTEFKDGKFITKTKLTVGETDLEPGDEIKPSHIPASIYFIILFEAMKRAGVEKPSSVTLNIAGARDFFNMEKSKASAPPSEPVTT